MVQQTTYSSKPHPLLLQNGKQILCIYRQLLNKTVHLVFFHLLPKLSLVGTWWPGFISAAGTHASFYGGDK